jgi:hypothetical protein
MQWMFNVRLTNHDYPYARNQQNARFHGFFKHLAYIFWGKRWSRFLQLSVITFFNGSLCPGQKWGRPVGQSNHKTITYKHCLPSTAILSDSHMNYCPKLFERHLDATHQRHCWLSWNMCLLETSGNAFLPLIYIHQHHTFSLLWRLILYGWNHNTT